MKLSHADILRNILKYKLQQRRRKTAGETPLKVYRSQRNRCAGCNVLQQRGILSCCNPPLCPDCHKVYNDAPSVRPENQEARRADHNRRRHLKRKALDADGKPMAPRLTRARERSAVDLTGDSDGDADAEDYVGDSGPVVERVHWTLRSGAENKPVRKDGKALSLGQAAAASAFVEAQSRIPWGIRSRNDLEKLRSCRNALQKLVDCGAGSESAWDSRTKSWMRDRGNRLDTVIKQAERTPQIAKELRMVSKLEPPAGPEPGEHADADLEITLVRKDGQGDAFRAVVVQAQAMVPTGTGYESRLFERHDLAFFRITAAATSSTPAGQLATDITVSDDEDNERPPENQLLAAHARATNERLVAVKREVVDERARADDQGTNAMYLTAQKSELQQLVSDTARALIDADVPTHECPDDATPFYYMLESHRDDGKQTVPWNAEAGRAMTLAEGIAWLQNNPPAKRRRTRRSEADRLTH